MNINNAFNKRITVCQHALTLFVCAMCSNKKLSQLLLNLHNLNNLTESIKSGTAPGFALQTKSGNPRFEITMGFEEEKKWGEIDG